MQDWQQLGNALVAARIRLGYPKRTDFQRALGLSHGRTLLDLENANRSNYDRSTLIQAEGWYGLAPGNIAEVLAGGPVRYADEAGGSVSGDGHGVLLDLPDSALEGLSEAEKQEVIARAKAEALRAAREIRRDLDEHGG